MESNILRIQHIFSPSEWSTKHSKKLIPPYAKHMMQLADMDFNLHEGIRKLFLESLTQCRDFTYKSMGDSVKNTIIRWYSKHRKTNIEKSWIFDSPSVAQAFTISVLSLTKQEQSILFFTPSYEMLPFIASKFQRKCVYSRMGKRKGRLFIDYQNVKLNLKNVKMVALCNPHNPTGQIFSKQQLKPLFQLIVEAPSKIILFVDEIFADLSLKPYSSSLNLGIGYDRLVVADSVSKAFNVSSVQAGYSIIPSAQLGQKYRGYQDAIQIWHNQPAMRMIVACYGPEGENWLSTVKQTITQNIKLLSNYIHTNIPALQFSIPDAGYLVVLNFRNVCGNGEQLRVLLQNCRLCAKPLKGSYQPEANEQLQIRISIAMHTRNIMEMLQDLKSGIQQRNPTPKL